MDLGGTFSVGMEVSCCRLWTSRHQRPVFAESLECFWRRKINNRLGEIRIYKFRARVSLKQPWPSNLEIIDGTGPFAKLMR